jgi:periplasmic divalent cation tolerance protein
VTLSESSAIVVLCTVPRDFDEAPLAQDLVMRSLAACVQAGLGVTSVYRWKGSMERSDERLLLIKTRAGRFAEVEAAIRAFHPYDVPEIVALSVSDGHAPYLAWIAENTAP